MSLTDHIVYQAQIMIFDHDRIDNIATKRGQCWHSALFLFFPKFTFLSKSFPQGIFGKRLMKASTKQQNYSLVKIQSICRR